MEKFRVVRPDVDDRKMEKFGVVQPDVDDWRRLAQAIADGLGQHHWYMRYSPTAAVFLFLGGERSRIIQTADGSTDLLGRAPVFPPVSFWSTLDYVFVHIPKTAGTSIRWAKSSRRIAYVDHLTAKQLLTVVPHEKLRTIVRNPYDRAVSAYFFNKHGGFGLTPILTRAMQTDFPTFESWVLKGGLAKSCFGEVDFQDSIADTPQLHWVIDLNPHEKCRSAIPMQNIGRFENLQADLKRLLGISEMPKLNASKHDAWQVYYNNPAVQEKVYQLYKNDFLVFGYSPVIQQF